MVAVEDQARHQQPQQLFCAIMSAKLLARMIITRLFVIEEYLMEQQGVLVGAFAVNPHLNNALHLEELSLLKKI